MKSHRAESLSNKPYPFGIDPRDGRMRSRIIHVVVTVGGCTLAAAVFAALAL